MLKFLARHGKAALDDVGRVGSSAAQTILQLFHRGRQNEAQHAVIGPQAAELPAALIVDVKKAIDTRSDRLLDGRDTGAVAIAVHDGPLRKLVVGDHAVEAFVADEAVVLAVDLTFSRAAGRVGNGKAQPELFCQATRQGGLAGARRR